jgi:hypothetical protein
LTTRLSEERETRGFSFGGCKRSITQSAAATSSNDKRFTGDDEICEHFTGCTAHNCPGRHVKHNVGGISAVTVCALSRLAICGCAVRSVVKLHQGRYLWINEGNNVPTATTIATVRPTEWLKFFTQNGRAAMPTIATLGMDRCLINECRHQLTCLSVHEMKKDGPKWTRLPWKNLP